MKKKDNVKKNNKNKNKVNERFAKSIKDTCCAS